MSDQENKLTPAKEREFVENYLWGYYSAAGEPLMVYPAFAKELEALHVVAPYQVIGWLPDV